MGNQNDGESIAVYVAELKKLPLTEADLTFNHAVEIAVAMETAARDSVELRSGVKMSVNKVTTAGKSKRTMQKVELCYHCDRGGHKANQCRFKTEMCRKCNKVGHKVGMSMLSPKTQMKKVTQGCCIRLCCISDVTVRV